VLTRRLGGHLLAVDRPGESNFAAAVQAKANR
jgi:hypothetical protein